MLKLIKLGFFAMFLVIFVSLIDGSNAYYTKPASGCLSSQDSECGNYCYYGGSGAQECCSGGNVVPISQCSSRGQQQQQQNQQQQSNSQQQTCTDNGQRSWNSCNAPDPGCGQTTTGTQTAVDNCGNPHTQDCTKVGVACTEPPTNSVYLGSTGGVGNSKCRNAGLGNCVEILRGNNNGVFEKTSQYSCSSNIGGSGYYAVCSGESGITFQPSTPSGGPVTSAPVASCRATTGSWNQRDSVNGEGCGQRTNHICPQNTNIVETKACNIRKIDFRITSCNSCDSACEGSGKDSGVCYSGALPFDAEIQRDFNIGIFNLGLGNAGCNTGQSCYCYDNEYIPVDRVNIVSTGMCTRSGETTLSSDGVQTVVNNVDIGGDCSNDNECTSGFCINFNSCIDGCSSLNTNNCETTYGNKCTLLFDECVNTGGYNRMTSLMAENLRDVNTNQIRILLDEYGVSGLLRGRFIDNPSSISGAVVSVNTRLEGCPDFNTDKKIDFDDFFAFADNFGRVVTRENQRFDVAKDNLDVINFDDFFRFADNFGEQNIECNPSTQEYTIAKIQDDCNNGVCKFKFKVKARYPSANTLDKLKINFNGVDVNDKEFNMNFAKGEVVQSSSNPDGFSVLDVTSSAIQDLSELKEDTTIINTLQAPSGRSRFECGLQLNPGFCCPAGYATSSDGSRCVLVASTTSYCADFNSDNKVDFVDYFYITDNFGVNSGEPGYTDKVDLDRDGRIGFGDFFIFVDEFGQEPNC